MSELNFAPEEAPGTSRADSLESDAPGPSGDDESPSDASRAAFDTDVEAEDDDRGRNGYDSNAREFDDEFNREGAREYDDDLDGVECEDDAGYGGGDGVGYEDDTKAQAGEPEVDGETALEDSEVGGGALGIIGYLWMFLALGLFAYLIMTVQDQAGTIKVLQRRVASLETRLGLQPMMPMEMST
mmetsp:Transcript_32989/g.83224  ORF Transcript_32989/g.83224 Transcript_32989/m.83224 type:complete len:185 (-) Transcript_32989:611-1165(-)